MQGEAEKINAIIGLVQMVVLIPVSVATAFSMSLVPEMTKAYTAGNTKLLYKHFTRTNVLVVAITVPAAIGMMVLAKPVYTLLFGAGNDPEMGRIILQYYAPACILFSLYSNGRYATRNQSTAEDGARTSDWNYCEDSFKYCIASVFRLCKFHHFNIRGLYDFSWV